MGSEAKEIFTFDQRMKRLWALPTGSGRGCFLGLCQWGLGGGVLSRQLRSGAPQAPKPSAQASSLHTARCRRHLEFRTWAALLHAVLS